MCYNVNTEGGMAMNGALGKQIKIYRSVQNYTQEQMAERLGISRQRYARIENGATSITFDILSKIADILDVKVSDITKVLDAKPALEYRRNGESVSSEKIMDMLDLFYANKHLYDRIKDDSEL